MSVLVPSSRMKPVVGGIYRVVMRVRKVNSIFSEREVIVGMLC